MVSMEELLNLMVQRGGSDLHLSVGAPPKIRIDGKLVDTEYEVLMPEATKKLVYSVLGPDQVAKLEKNLEIDFSFGVQTLGRFRTNAFVQRGSVAAVLRVIPYEVYDFQTIGLPVKVCEWICNLPRGLVLCTGSTGSGKSTTLASMINYINESRQGHIITIEDPIEFLHRNKGCLINQREVGGDTHGFDKALKSVLRQDPDVVLVGEIRDQETADIAIKAALTGHLVLSTLHTNSAPETVTRLLDMGLEPFNVASALNLVLAQRLVRRICSRCRHKYIPDEVELGGAKVKAETTFRELRFTTEALENAKSRALPDALPHLANLSLDSCIGDIPFFKGRGCDDCNGTGLKGRQGLYEVMFMTPHLRKLILMNVGAQEIRDAAIEEGMLTLRMDGWLKVLKGITTLEQVIRETAV